MLFEAWVFKLSQERLGFTQRSSGSSSQGPTATFGDILNDHFVLHGSGLDIERATSAGVSEDAVWAIIEDSLVRVAAGDMHFSLRPSVVASTVGETSRLDHGVKLGAHPMSVVNGCAQASSEVVRSHRSAMWLRRESERIPDRRGRVGAQRNRTSMSSRCTSMQPNTMWNSNSSLVQRVPEVGLSHSSSRRGSASARSHYERPRGPARFPRGQRSVRTWQPRFARPLHHVATGRRRCATVTCPRAGGPRCAR
jgi:hypothetical protein